MHAQSGRRRDYPAIYRHRLELYPGKSARGATGHGTKPCRVTATTADDRRFAEVAARNGVLDAVSRMRRDGVSLTSAARDAGTTPDAVRRYAGSALERRSSRWVAKPNDRLLRWQFTTIIGPGGEPTEALVETHSFRQSSEIGSDRLDGRGRPTAYHPDATLVATAFILELGSYRNLDHAALAAFVAVVPVAEKGLKAACRCYPSKLEDLCGQTRDANEKAGGHRSGIPRSLRFS